jgi:hypothetical protein
MDIQEQVDDEMKEKVDPLLELLNTSDTIKSFS